MPNAMRSRKATSDEVDAQRLAAVEAQMLRIEGLMADIRRLATTEIDGLRSELAHRAGELGDDIMATRRQIASEVRTRRVVVVNERGHEGVVVSAKDRHSEVTVTSEDDPSVRASLQASDEDGAVSGALYLSGGGNVAAMFLVNRVDLDPDTKDEVVEYRSALHMMTPSDDPRFHDITLDREGLSFGG